MQDPTPDLADPSCGFFEPYGALSPWDYGQRDGGRHIASLRNWLPRQAQGPSSSEMCWLALLNG